MTNFLAEARADLSELLDGYKVHEVRPESIPNPPCIVVEAQDTYVTPSNVFGDWNVNLALTCVIETATNKRVIYKGDELITDVIERLRGHWTVQSVSSQMISFDDGETYLYAPSINITATYSAEL